NAVTNTPILRPLLSLDKEEIVQKAKDIGTFETSIQPYEDCCTIFTPKNPVTEPQFEKVLQYESGFDFEEMIDRAVGNIETIVIDKNYQTHQDEQNTWDDDLF
ncbi:tRNA 4-thiouridine(8) synthase ThiI, partial [Staphylococcus pseudintermedius]